MKSTDSIDQIALQVQNNLFQYFYYHNRMNFEGSFCSPRDFHNNTSSPNNQGNQFQILEDSSSQASHGSETYLSRNLKPQMKVL